MIRNNCILFDTGAILFFTTNDLFNTNRRMLAIPIISTAIAIIISWGLFGLFCSFVHEAIAQTKAERGRFMRRYLFKQLQDLPNGVNWASMLYLHGTIDLLSREASKPTNEIQPHVFAKTLIEVVGNAHIVQTQLPLLQQSLLRANSAANKQSPQFINITQNYFSHAILYNFKAATQVLKSSSVVSMLIQAMNNAELQAANSTTDQWITEARIYDHLVLFIEKWYSDFTERLTYWYRKKTKQRLFIMGCVFGLFFNIDSIQLFSFYTANPASREAVINYYQQNADTLNGLAKRMEYTSSTNIDSAIHTVTPLMPSQLAGEIDTTLALLRRQNSTPPTPQVYDNAAAKALADSLAAAKNGILIKMDTAKRNTDSAGNVLPVHNPSSDTLHLLSKTILLQIDSLRKTANLPVGFQYSIFKQPVHWFYPLLLKLLGILISGLAASFGGPFWFDVLRKLYTRK